MSPTLRDGCWSRRCNVNSRSGYLARLRVRTKLFVVLAIPCAIVAITSVVFALARENVRAGYEDTMAWREHAESVASLGLETADFLDAVALVVDAPGDGTRARVRYNAAEVATARSRVLELTRRFSRKETAEDEQIAENVETFVIAGLDIASNPSRAALADLRHTFAVSIDPMIDARVAEEREGSEESARAGLRSSDRMQLIAAGIALVLLIAGLAACVHVARSITRPLAYLGNQANLLARGKLDQSIALGGSDELSALANTFDQMAGTLNATMVSKAELVEANRKTAISEKQHRLLFDANPVPIWVFDVETLQLTAVNDAMARTHGYSRDELLALKVTELVVDNGKHRHKNGQLLDFNDTSHPVILDGRPSTLAIGIDVTETRRLESQLRQTQKLDAVGQLAGGIAHDFNNLLAVAIANCDFLDDTMVSDPDAREAIDEIKTVATRGAALSRQLLAFSRRQPVQLKPVDVNAVVGALDKLLGRVVGEQIELKVVLGPEVSAIPADAGQLEQAITNLVLNARDAMPAGGRITIKTAHVELDSARAAEAGLQPGRFVELSVEDNGFGMSPAVQARIFEPFFTTKPIGKGTGLGLAMVFGIVKHAGGGITVESATGRGTRFRLYFPVLAKVNALSAATASAKLPRGTETILVVEDEAPLRASITRLLGSWGYRVHAACDGGDALRVLGELHGAVDLVLSDIVMPAMDGLALADQLSKRYPHLSVLFMSGYSDHDSLRSTARPEQLLAKPFSSAELSNLVRRALDSERDRAVKRAQCETTPSVDVRVN